MEKWELVLVIYQETETTYAQDPTGRQARAHRILDAAAELMLRWGYNKTTIDDIAKQAGVAKGTIYLHWKTREELFLALMRREKAELNKDFKAQIRTELAPWRLSAIVKQSALALVKRPLLKAALLRDMDVLGKLLSSEERKTSQAERMALFITYLEFLRQQGLVRTDQTLHQQVYALSAIFMGFFQVAPLLPGESTPSPEEMAELIAETVHCALERERTLTAEEDEALVQRWMQYVDQAAALAQEQLQQALTGSFRLNEN